MAHGYRDLEVWRKSMRLARTVYQLTRCFPTEEKYGLTSQLRRSAASIPANIAEGTARSGSRDFIRFLGIAAGSLAELETHLLLSRQLGISTRDQVAPALDQASEVARMLNGLKRSLRERATTPPSPSAN